MPGTLLIALDHYLLRPQSCLILCNPMDYSPWGSSVQGTFQPRILEWVAISSSRGSSPPRARTCIFCSSYNGRQILYPELPGKPVNCFKVIILFNPQNGMRIVFYTLFTNRGFPGGSVRKNLYKWEIEALKEAPEHITGMWQGWETSIRIIWF